MLHRMSMIRKAGLLLLAMAVALSFSGCGRNHDESGPDSLLNVSTGSNNSENSSAESESEGVQFEAELSYVNSDYIKTGDETKDKLIRNVKQTLSAADSDEKLQIEAVIRALRTVPEDLTDAETFVSDVFAVNSLKFSGSSLVMDLSSDGLESLDMYDEQFFVYQVTDSILNTFPDLEGIRFTVDGTYKDSLNYVDISSVFKDSDVNTFIKGEAKEAEETAVKENTTNVTKKPAEKMTEEENADDNNEENHSQSENTDSVKNSKKSTSSSSGSNSSENQSSVNSSTKSNSSGSQTSGSSSSGSQSQSSSSKKSSGNSASSGKSSSSSSSKSGSQSGSQSSSSSENGNGSTSGVANDSDVASGGSSSSTTQDGVVNDEDL